MSSPTYDPCAVNQDARRLGADDYVTGYLGPNLDFLNWHGGEYLYAFTLITTIGYGVFVPTTKNGKMLSILYAFIGFCLVGFCFGKSTVLIDDFAKKLILKSGCYRKSKKQAADSKDGGRAKSDGSDSDNDGFQVKARFVSEDMNDDLEEEGDLESPLLVFHTVLTFGWVTFMGLWFAEQEHWESKLDGFYFAFITSTTIGFGDLAPDITKLWLSTYIFMLFGLLFMAVWLGAAGDVFFKIVSCGIGDITHALHTPMHAVGDRMKKVEAAQQAEKKMVRWRSKPRFVSKSKSLHKMASVALEVEEAFASKLKRVITSPLLVSWVTLFLVMCCGAAMLSELEWETAKAGALEWNQAYDEMIAEFEAHENMTGIAGSSMKEDVEQALALLNSMGTCDSPASEEDDMDWTFKAAMLYVFYVCSTIGYGDMNVATDNGKICVMIYSVIGMWIFGWASSHLSELMERFNSIVAQRLFNKWRDIKNAAVTRKAGVEMAGRKEELKAAFDKMDESGDGEIDVKELNGLAKSLGVEFDEDDLGHVLKAIDVDNSGTIGFDEFNKMMSHLSPTKGFDVKDFIGTIKKLVRLEAPMLICISIVFLLLSSLIIKWAEQPQDMQQWAYVDTLWFMVISTTTIGLGDLSPNWNMPWTASGEVVLMAAGCVLIALMIGVIVGWYEDELETIEDRLDHTIHRKKIVPTDSPDTKLAPQSKYTPGAQEGELAKTPSSKVTLPPLSGQASVPEANPQEQAPEGLRSEDIQEITLKEGSETAFVQE